LLFVDITNYILFALLGQFLNEIKILTKPWRVFEKVHAYGQHNGNYSDLRHIFATSEKWGQMGGGGDMIDELLL